MKRPPLPTHTLRNARRLRRGASEAEALLWSRLRRRGLGGLRFRRQHPIPPYVADFACFEARLVIEVDGAQHLSPGHVLSDKDRDQVMARSGWSVLRLPANEVVADLDACLELILARCRPHHP